MHPAPSIILFTVLSGFGFGLISIVGLLQFLNKISMVDIIIFSVIGLFFSTVGLISSFFHLANKKMQSNDCNNSVQNNCRIK